MEWAGIHTSNTTSQSRRQQQQKKRNGMIDSSESLYTNITLNDIQLAAAYYPILIDLAKHKHCLTYGELVEKAKATYPQKEYVQKAIAVSTGRKLDIVRIFTNERDLPDLSSLIINKSLGECGTGFTDHFDPEKVRAEVFAYDWSDVRPEFDLYIKDAEEKAKPKKKVNRSEATKLMAEYYKEKKDRYPDTINQYREGIIVLIMEGVSPEKAFNECVYSAK